MFITSDLKIARNRVYSAYIARCEAKTGTALPARFMRNNGVIRLVDEDGATRATITPVGGKYYAQPA